MEVDIDRVMMRFPEELNLKFLVDDEFFLMSNFTYKSENHGLITCPAEYLTDGASIPKFAWVLIGSPWSGKYPRAAVIHDWLCSSEGVILNTRNRLTKKETDDVFLEMMKFLGVSWFKRCKMHKAVRLARRKFDWEK